MFLYFSYLIKCIFHKNSQHRQIRRSTICLIKRETHAACKRGGSKSFGVGFREAPGIPRGDPRSAGRAARGRTTSPSPPAQRHSVNASITASNANGQNTCASSPARVPGPLLRMRFGLVLPRLLPRACRRSFGFFRFGIFFFPLYVAKWL